MQNKGDTDAAPFERPATAWAAFDDALTHSLRKANSAMISTEQDVTTTPAAERIAANTQGGALDALVNYWLARILFTDEGEEKAVPEFNLGECASEMLCKYLDAKELEPSVAFELGLELAAIVAKNPLDAEAAIRAGVDRAVRRSDEIFAGRANVE